MKSRVTFWIGIAGLGLVLGCFGDYPGGGKEQTKPGTGKPPATATSPTPASPSAPPSSSTARVPPPAQGVSIHLSAGVALPQTGPEGTMMGFSVDYEFDQGQPQPSEEFVWVIERSQGEPAKLSKKLKPKGSLDTFLITGWRPEQGPFRTSIEDSRGQRVSDKVDLRAP
jgi:hypothetical protein